MSVNEFMEYDTDIVLARIKAMKNKRYNDAYVNGYYTNVALNCALSGFGKNPTHYPKEPLHITEERIQKESRMTELEKDQMYRDTLMQWR